MICMISLNNYLSLIYFLLNAKRHNLHWGLFCERKMQFPWKNSIWKELELLTWVDAICQHWFIFQEQKQGFKKPKWHGRPILECSCLRKHFSVFPLYDCTEHKNTSSPLIQSSSNLFICESLIPTGINGATVCIQLRKTPQLLYAHWGSLAQLQTNREACGWRKTRRLK